MLNVKWDQFNEDFEGELVDSACIFLKAKGDCIES